MDIILIVIGLIIVCVIVLVAMYIEARQAPKESEVFGIEQLYGTKYCNTKEEYDEYLKNWGDVVDAPDNTLKITYDNGKGYHSFYIATEKGALLGRIVFIDRSLI